jgi:LysM repeat protein
MNKPVVFACRGRDLNRLGGVQMASLRRKLIYLLLAFIFVLTLSACVRPFGQSEAEQAEQATQEAEAQAADQAEEEPQAEEETSEAVEEAVEPESEAEETAPEETEAEAVEEVEESEEAVTSDPDVGGGAPESEEEAPAAEETPPAEEEAATEEAAEGEAEMSEETAAEDADAEEAAEEAPAEEAAAEEEMAEETEAEEPVTTLPATHTVAAGENLFRIGLKYGISWVPLAIYNDISNPNLIYTGQVLRIPGGQAPPTETAPEGAAYTEYVVKRGDTVYKISRAFGVSPQEIVEANGLVNPNLIYAGQVLKIPTG